MEVVEDDMASDSTPSSSEAAEEGTDIYMVA